MDRRRFLLHTGQFALLLRLAPATILAQQPGSPNDLQKLYRDSIVIDGLCWPVTGDTLAAKPADLEQAAQSGVTAINATVSLPDFDATVKMIAAAQALVDGEPHRWLIVRRHSDIALAKRDGKTAIILGFQSPQFQQEMQRRKDTGIAAPEEDRMPFVPGLNSPRKIELIAEDLSRRGQPASVIEKVIGGNFHRVLGEIWGMAQARTALS